eukprot:5209057-Prymnesium_polylepis.1
MRVEPRRRARGGAGAVELECLADVARLVEEHAFRARQVVDRVRWLAAGRERAGFDAASFQAWAADVHRQELGREERVDRLLLLAQRRHWIVKERCEHDRKRRWDGDLAEKLLAERLVGLLNEQLHASREQPEAEDKKRNRHWNEQRRSTLPDEPNPREAADNGLDHARQVVVEEGCAHVAEQRILSDLGDYRNSPTRCPGCCAAHYCQHEH